MKFTGSDVQDVKQTWHGAGKAFFQRTTVSCKLFVGVSLLDVLTSFEDTKLQNGTSAFAVALDPFYRRMPGLGCCTMLLVQSDQKKSKYKQNTGTKLDGWRPLVLGWRPSLLGWRPLLLGC